jgi:hypothetical protein
MFLIIKIVENNTQKEINWNTSHEFADFIGIKG